jgi:hypothetical protein
VGVEPSYLKSLIPWVEQGGRLVVAVKDVSPTGIMAMSADLKNQPNILQILGLDAVDAMPRSPVDGMVQPSRSSWTPELKPLRDVLSEAWSRKEVLPLTIPVTQKGNLPRTEWPIQQLSLPGDQVGTFDAVDAKPAGTLEVLIAKQPVTLAASFMRGKGEIVLVAEPQLFSNRLLAQADNSILAARLLAPDGQRVFIDEFYHGLSVRGNSLYLLTQPGYAALALGLLFVACLVIWREAIFLGPSLRDETIGRRDIGEYLRAMGRFFSIGHDSRPFLLKQMREGVLRELSTEQSLPTETQDADLIASVLARRNPTRAEALRTALRDVDAILESRQDLTEAQTLDALRRLTSCLSKPR